MTDQPGMKGRIVVELHDDGDEFEICVDVSGDLDTLTAVALLEVAKMQHLAAKHAQGPSISTLQAPWPESPN